MEFALFAQTPPVASALAAALPAGSSSTVPSPALIEAQPADGDTTRTRRLPSNSTSSATATVAPL